MSKERPEQLILVGNRTVALPDEITITEWALERDNLQNQRIKAVLGSIQMLEEVLDSNYAILHCSPDRLQEIWRRVREVADSVRNRLGPLLSTPSVVPHLEEALQSGRATLEVLSRTTLQDLGQYSDPLPPDELLAMRKLLCVSIGKLHSFLQDTFGRLMEADPRSKFDRDYFLSRRFPRDVEEAEWLYKGVSNLADFVREVLRDSNDTVLPLVNSLREEEVLPAESSWETVEQFVDVLRDVTVKLHEVLALRGIRFDEMEVLDHYARALPEKYHQLTALYEIGHRIAERIKATAPGSWPQREQSLTDLLHTHAVTGDRVATLAQAIHSMILDLDAFLPIWYRSIGERRALLLYGTHLESSDALSRLRDAAPTPIRAAYGL
ncbi:MAG: hypothetical protein ACE5GX_08185 [Thermoanaerobaculia bacterium]